MFGFGKDKNAEPVARGCACQQDSPVESAAEKIAPAGTTGGGHATEVKVLGAGCASCHKLLENAQAAIERLGGGIDLEYVTDIDRVVAYGVMRMPALVVDGKVVSSGAVLSPDEIAGWLG